MTTSLSERVARPDETEAAAPRRRGSPEAETAFLYGQYRQRLLAFCTNRLGNRAEAEDAVQETFAYALRLLRRGVVPEAELPWLYTIAFNVCRSKRRAASRRSRVEAPVDLDAIQDVVAAPDRTADRLDGLGEALATMPPNQRDAFVLRELRGHSYREIATALSLSESAVATLLFRARESLASRLQQGGRRVAAALNGASLVVFLRRFAQWGNVRTGTAALVAGAAAFGTAGSVERRVAPEPDQATPAELVMPAHVATRPTPAVAPTRPTPKLHPTSRRAVAPSRRPVTLRPPEPAPPNTPSATRPNVPASNVPDAQPKPPPAAAAQPASPQVDAAPPEVGAVTDAVPSVPDLVDPVADAVAPVVADANDVVDGAVETANGAVSTVTTAVSQISPPPPPQIGLP